MEFNVHRRPLARSGCALSRKCRGTCVLSPTPSMRFRTYIYNATPTPSQRPRTSTSRIQAQYNIPRTSPRCKEPHLPRHHAVIYTPTPPPLPAIPLPTHHPPSASATKSHARVPYPTSTPPLPYRRHSITLALSLALALASSNPRDTIQCDKPTALIQALQLRCDAVRCGIRRGECMLLRARAWERGGTWVSYALLRFVSGYWNRIESNLI